MCLWSANSVSFNDTYLTGHSLGAGIAVLAIPSVDGVTYEKDDKGNLVKDENGHYKPYKPEGHMKAMLSVSFICVSIDIMNPLSLGRPNGGLQWSSTTRVIDGSRQGKLYQVYSRHVLI